MSKKVLTKKELETLIEIGDESVGFVEKTKTSGSSELWKYYHYILVDGHRQQLKNRPAQDLNNDDLMLKMISITLMIKKSS